MNTFCTTAVGNVWVDWRQLAWNLQFRSTVTILHTGSPKSFTYLFLRKLECKHCVQIGKFLNGKWNSNSTFPLEEGYRADTGTQLRPCNPDLLLFRFFSSHNSVLFGYEFWGFIAVQGLVTFNRTIIMFLVSYFNVSERWARYSDPNWASLSLSASMCHWCGSDYLLSIVTVERWCLWPATNMPPVSLSWKFSWCQASSPYGKATFQPKFSGIPQEFISELNYCLYNVLCL